MPQSPGAAERAAEAGDPTQMSTRSTPAFDELPSHRRLFLHHAAKGH